MGIYVELKGAGTGRALGEMVRRGDAEGVEVLGGSFIPELVAQLRAVAPEAPRSVLFGPVSFEEMVAVCQKVEARYVHPCFRQWKGTGGPVWTAETVERFHAAGLTVMTPHTNDVAEEAEFERMGMDVIASDDPRVLAQFRPI